MYLQPRESDSYEADLDIHSDIIFSFGSLATAFTQPDFYVDQNATAAANDGTSWCDAFLELRDALDPAINTELEPGDVIWVADGTYLPSGTGDDEDTFQLIGRVEVYGGFEGASAPDESQCAEDGETTLEQRNPDPRTNNTVLSGDVDSNDSGGTISGDNSLVIVKAPLNDSAILDGFKIIRATRSAIENGDGFDPSNPTYANRWITQPGGPGRSRPGVTNSAHERPCIQKTRCVTEKRGPCSVSKSPRSDRSRALR